MGAGHLYPYRHFMLIDQSHDYFLETEIDENDEDEEVFSEVMYNDFLEALCYEVTKQSILLNQYKERNVTILFSSDNLNYCLDSSGGMIALFVERINEEETTEEQMDEEVKRYFNLFIQIYSDVFRKPTSAWTSESYISYP